MPHKPITHSSLPILLLILALTSSLSGCHQVPLTTATDVKPIDETFEPVQHDDTIPIEKELAPPKGFFGRSLIPYGGLTSEARAIEQSLGVNR